MDDLFSIQLSVPMFQIMLLLTIITLSLLFGYLKQGMFFCYLFMFYWGNLFNIRSIFENVESSIGMMSFMYLGFGLIISFLAMIGFMFNKN